MWLLGICQCVLFPAIVHRHVGLTSCADVLCPFQPGSARKSSSGERTSRFRTTYDGLFSGRDPSEGRDSFWEELFLLKVPPPPSPRHHNQQITTTCNQTPLRLDKSSVWMIVRTSCLHHALDRAVCTSRTSPWDIPPFGRQHLFLVAVPPPPSRPRLVCDRRSNSGRAT